MKNNLQNRRVLTIFYNQLSLTSILYVIKYIVAGFEIDISPASR